MLWGAVTLSVPLASASSSGTPFKPDDVIAFVGGEDVAASAENGRLELLLTKALPDHRLKFRHLAREGDTVFQQPRDLNYPPLPQQLDQCGATVILVQFGQMESLAGESGLSDFVAAYERLLDWMGGAGKRRLVVLGPTPVSRDLPARDRFKTLPAYAAAVRGIAGRREIPGIFMEDAAEPAPDHFRDGIHLNENGLLALARLTAQVLGVGPRAAATNQIDERRLAGLIRTKNLLWFNYARPQNWAFLDGDRTVQPSSRDHLDPSIRWFPDEMKRWLPLLEAREREIWQLAGQSVAR
ncbi:MAG: hypothetical protein RL077_4345 [Verrucomicrobiota bacterium]